MQLLMTPPQCHDQNPFFLSEALELSETIEQQGFLVLRQLDRALVHGLQLLDLAIFSISSSTHHRQMQPQKSMKISSKRGNAKDIFGNAVNRILAAWNYGIVWRCQWFSASGTPSSALRYFTRTCSAIVFCAGVRVAVDLWMYNVQLPRAVNDHHGNQKLSY